MAISVASLGTGWVVDILGPKRSIMLGAAILTIGRVTLAITESTVVGWGLLVIVLPVGEALGIPVLAQAIGVVSKPSEAKLNYGLFYTAMNVAILCVGPAVDGVRGSPSLVLATGIPPYRLLVWLSSGASFLSFILASTFLNVGPSVVKDEDSNADRLESGSLGALSEELWTPTFRHFLKVVVALVGVRCLFRHLDATFPKYVVRAFGENAPYGMLYAINPSLIILLVPVLSSVGASGAPADLPKGSCTESMSSAFPFLDQLTRLPPLRLIFIGATISSLSVLWLVVTTSLTGAALFVATLSIGEALWSPTFYTWTHTIAPPQQAGRYFALSNVPLFLPKLIAGIMSGALLEKYCRPLPDVCEDPNTLWLAIFASACPFVLLLNTQRWL